MARVTPKTIGESLYWSYANLAMAFASARHEEPDYQQRDFIVRNKIYHGLSRGTLQIGSLIIDEKEKLATSGLCCYCASDVDLTLDHLIPQFKGGPHSADNLVVACRSCNSSKRALDLLEWMAKRDVFPPLGLLRRYLKFAIRYCIENGLMDKPLETPNGLKDRVPTLFDTLDASETAENDVIPTTCPFAIHLIPYDYPEPGDLWGRATDAEGLQEIEPF